MFMNFNQIMWTVNILFPHLELKLARCRLEKTLLFEDQRLHYVTFEEVGLVGNLYMWRNLCVMRGE